MHSIFSNFKSTVFSCCSRFRKYRRQTLFMYRVNQKKSVVKLISQGGHFQPPIQNFFGLVVEQSEMNRIFENPEPCFSVAVYFARDSFRSYLLQVPKKIYFNFRQFYVCRYPTRIFFLDDINRVYIEISIQMSSWAFQQLSTETNFWKSPSE